VSEKYQRPPDWAVVFHEDEDHYDKDRLDDMANILTAIMYVLADASKDVNGMEQEKENND